MNFMNWEGPATGLELKYCERCGSLWLRLQGDSEVYCTTCRTRMAELPRPSREHTSTSNPRLPRPDPDDIQCQCQIKSLQGVVEVEVRP
jgi:DNA-directed RNA polymerase subunit RPC12/RpoP